MYCGKFIDVALMHIGKGHIIMIAYIPKTNTFFIRREGNANEQEKKEIIDSYLSDDFQPDKYELYQPKNYSRDDMKKNIKCRRCLEMEEEMKDEKHDETHDEKHDETHDETHNESHDEIDYKKQDEMRMHFEMSEVFGNTYQYAHHDIMLIIFNYFWQFLILS
jgi:hypothetical protein